MSDFPRGLRRGCVANAISDAVLSQGSAVLVGRCTRLCAPRFGILASDPPLHPMDVSLVSHLACHRGMSCGMPRYVAAVFLRVGFSAYNYHLVVKPCTLSFH
eukprot:4093508-Pyramimonas_sp.AAC.1